MITDKNNLSEKFSLVIYNMSVSVGNNFIDERQKKNSPASFGTFIAEYNISLTKKSYVIPSVILFVRR
jgi:hypothetical protein